MLAYLHAHVARTQAAAPPPKAPPVVSTRLQGPPPWMLDRAAESYRRAHRRQLQPAAGGRAV